MPLTKKGEELIKSMHEQYGKKKGDEVFYASRNEGKITSVEHAKKIASSLKGKKNGT